MVSHSDDKDRTAIDVFATESVLSGLVDLVDDEFISGDLVRSVLLIPLEPFAPLFDGFLTVEFTGNREAGDGVDVGVEILALFAVLVLILEDFLDLGLVRFYLSELAVSDTEGVFRVHIHQVLNYKWPNL